MTLEMRGGTPPKTCFVETDKIQNKVTRLTTQLLFYVIKQLLHRKQQGREGEALQFLTSEGPNSHCKASPDRGGDLCSAV